MENFNKIKTIIWIGEEAEYQFQNSNDLIVDKFKNIIIKYSAFFEANERYKKNDIIYLENVFPKLEIKYEKQDLQMALEFVMEHKKIPKDSVLVIGDPSELMVQAFIANSGEQELFSTESENEMMYLNKQFSEMSFYDTKISSVKNSLLFIESQGKFVDIQNEISNCKIEAMNKFTAVMTCKQNALNLNAFLFNLETNLGSALENSSEIELLTRN